MMKCDTIKQYKILEFIERNFYTRNFDLIGGTITITTDTDIFEFEAIEITENKSNEKLVFYYDDYQGVVKSGNGEFDDNVPF